MISRNDAITHSGGIPRFVFLLYCQKKLLQTEGRKIRSRAKFLDITHNPFGADSAFLIIQQPKQNGILQIIDDDNHNEQTNELTIIVADQGNLGDEEEEINKNEN